MPKQITELPVASSVSDTDLTIVKQTATDRSATIAQINDNIGTAINRAASKATLTDTDNFGISDSSASSIIKKFSWANVKAQLKSHFESVVFTWALRQVFSQGISLPVSTGIRFDGGDISTNADFDSTEATTANVIFRFFRNTNTSGVRQFVIYKGDGTGTAVLSLNVGTGDFTLNGNTIWHAGNDGAGSGLDADTLDGSNIGTAVGNIVQLEDVGGNPGLPAVDGSQLTNLPDSDENVKASGTDTTPSSLINKLSAGSGISLDLQNSGGNETLQVSASFVSNQTPRYHLIARAATNGQTVINLGGLILDDVSDPYQGELKNHLIFMNGQLLINTVFDDFISPSVGDYTITNAATGEITLQNGLTANAGAVFTYLDIRNVTAQSV